MGVGVGVGVGVGGGGEVMLMDNVLPSLDIKVYAHKTSGPTEFPFT